MELVPIYVSLACRLLSLYISNVIGKSSHLSLSLAHTYIHPQLVPIPIQPPIYLFGQFKAIYLILGLEIQLDSV